MTAERYSITVSRSAERDLDKLDRTVLSRVAAAIDALTLDPRPPGCRKLINRAGTWRVRVGDWRVLYEVDDAARLVRIVAVRHRSRADE
ncbi:MAG: type II toxin-antitoxin system RelE/ParE family toxin [Acidobacteria bacterium]|nr:type II toxin-antitoxin system RelE/ParE family toxin [Acidobacteriota bacterium]